MPKIDISVREMVDMIDRGELRLPELQRRYVWPATRVRDLLDSLYRGYASGAILVRETTEDTPSRDLAIEQRVSAFGSHKLLLDGQQRLTSLSAVLRGEPLKFRNRSARSRSPSILTILRGLPRRSLRLTMTNCLPIRRLRMTPT